MHLNGCPHGHSSALGNKNTEHKPDARASGADGVEKKMRAADNSTENLSQPAFKRAYCSPPRKGVSFNNEFKRKKRRHSRKKKLFPAD